MNRLITLLTLLALASFVGCNTAQQPSPQPSNNLMKLAEGDYLSTDYIEELKRTRSPLKAGGRGGLDLVQARRDGNQFVLTSILNFHEGGAGCVLHGDGSIALKPTYSAADASHVTATVLNDHSFRFGYEEFKPATFLWVNDAAVYTSKTVLAGKYKDDKGRNYEFQEDGWAAFPDRKFEFEIGLDHVLVDFDYFMDTAHDKKHLPRAVWAFKWDRNTLQIFRTKEVDGFDQIADSHPYLTLHPVVRDSRK